MDLMQPLEITNTKELFDVDAKVRGGGFSGQTGAIRHAITRALLAYDSTTPEDSENSFRKVLKKEGFITRDPRKKERKKPGLKKHVVLHNSQRDRKYYLFQCFKRPRLWAF